MKSNRWVSRAAGAGALTLILAMPAVAQTRGRDAQRNDLNRTGQQTYSRGDQRDNSRGSSNDNRGYNNDNRGYSNDNRGSNNDRQSSNNSYRDNERVTLQGKVTSFTHENGGYRVRLDRDSRSFWVPESYARSRGRNLGIGVSISLGGIFRGGMINVDAVSWPDDGGYGYGGGYEQGYIRGVVDRVDYRTGVMWLRDDASGRLIQADMRDAGRYGRVDSQDLRRGDRVELSGAWLRGNVFAVSRVDSVRTGRY
jgi:hypothetical protein